MTQTWNVPQNLQNSKAIDYAFVISGWPTIYTVSQSYALPTTGDLSTTASGFIGPTLPWADIPDGVGEETRGRPEEGSCTIPQVDVTLVDRVVNGKRAVTDLISTQYYTESFLTRPAPHGIEGGSLPYPPRLVEPLAAGAPPSDATVNSTFALTSAPNQVVYVGRECIKFSSAGATKLNGLTRGYRLTSPVGHAGSSAPNVDDGSAVYTSMPTLYWRKAFVYKGYQGLSLDQWKPAFTGVIGGITKDGARVTFSLYSTMWLAYANGQQMLLGQPKKTTAAGVFRATTLVEPVNPGNFGWVVLNADDISNLDNGHYLLNIAGTWFGVTDAS